MKNVILISFDSLRSDYIAQLNPKDAPNFCYLRDHGAFFENTIVQAPLTVPSHLSMLSGLFPSKTGVRDMHHRISSEIPTLFSILKPKGLEGMFSSSMLIDRGIGGIDQHILLSEKKLTKSISRTGKKMFLAFLHYWGIHTPYETSLPCLKPIDVILNILKPLNKFQDIRFIRCIPSLLWNLRVKRIREMMKEGNSEITTAITEGYKNAIITADRFLGKILKVLKVTGVADETLLVITSDHGDSFNEHNEINRSTDKRYEHGQFLYDNIIKVPLIFFSSKKSFARSFDFQTQQVDIVPTILEALLIDYAGYLDGKSLWGAITGDNSYVGNEFVFSEVVRESLDLELRCVRCESSKLICDYKKNTYELYDLRTDPGEQKNLWPANDYNKKTKLMLELEAFSRIGGEVKVLNSEQEQQIIEDRLRNLGYMD